MAAGFLDRVAPPADVPDVARGVAGQLATLDMRAHGATKLRARARTLEALRSAIEADNAEIARSHVRHGAVTLARRGADGGRPG